MTLALWGSRVVGGCQLPNLASLMVPGGPYAAAPEKVVARISNTVGAPGSVMLIIGVVVLVAVLVAARWWLRNRYLPPATVLLNRLAELDEVAVLVHPRPDPDAMASAVAIQHMAEYAGTPATIQFPGEIRHPENRAFLTVLDIDLDHVEHVEEMAADAVVLVDHNRARGFEGADDVEPYAVVDHHPGPGEGTAFTDIRTGYGACATIVAEYLEALGAERDSDVEMRHLQNGSRANDDDRLVLPDTLATGVAFGILSDTTFLTRGCSRPDFAGLEYLYPSIDETLLDRIANPQVDAEVLEARARAVIERNQRTPYVVSDVGGVENLDAIPQAADELLQLEGVSATAVLGQKEGMLYVSARSRDDRVHVGRTLEAALADVPSAGAGGHARMAGGQMPLEEVSELRPASGFLQSQGTITRDALHERLFEAMAGEE